MAQNVSLMGADYPDVPAVQLPKTGGGTATFYDIEPVYHNYGVVNVTLCRSGNVCYLSVVVGSWSNSEAGGVLSATISSTNVTLTIPSGFKPVTNCEIREAGNNKRVTVTTEGNVICNEKLSGTNLRFSGCWITADSMPA